MLGYISVETADDDYRIDLYVLDIIKPYLSSGINQELSLAISDNVWDIAYKRGLKDVQNNILGYPIYINDLDETIENFLNSLKVDR